MCLFRSTGVRLACVFLAALAFGCHRGSSGHSIVGISDTPVDPGTGDDDDLDPGIWDDGGDETDDSGGGDESSDDSDDSSDPGDGSDDTSDDSGSGGHSDGHGPDSDGDQAPVPEPATILLLGGGFAALIASRRRSRRA